MEKNVEIKFVESRSFFGTTYRLIVDGYEHYLGRNENCEQYAVTILKEIYNIDFNIEDVIFEWDYTL